MKKAVISVFIVLTLVLNVFGFGVLSSRASALVGIDDVLLGVIITGIGALASGVVFSMAQSETEYISANWDSWMADRVENNAFTSGEFITLDLFDNHFEPVSGLSGYDSEMATFVCDYLNNNSNLDVVISGYRAEYGDVGIQNGEIKADLYCTLKTAAINAFEAYINVKRQVKDAISEYNSALDAIDAAMGSDWDPSYQFSFEDDVTPVNLSDVNSICDVTIEGVHFFSPILITYTEPNGWPTRATIESLGGDVAFAMTESGYYGTKTINPGYGGSCYVIYDNDIYFNYYSAHRSQPYVNEQIFITIPGTNNLHDWVNVRGQTLSSKVNSANDVLGSYLGIYAWTGPGNLENRPILSSLPTNNDFTNTSEGGSITIPKTEGENAVTLAQQFGIVGEDPTIELNPDGSISSVDGISLATLENLLQELIDKTYDFSSFEEYLTTIVTLLQAANVNTDQIDDVLNALRAWEANQENALNAINTNVASIAEALTQEYDIDDDTETQDNYIVEHAGLTEANALVNTSMPFVGQMRTLINNLFDPNNFNNTPPNFHFYADFDNDGNNERYNALDLSFLEIRLTNENLEDKGRFAEPVTVRELLQDILVLIVYSFFAFSMLKRIPSLLNGSSSDEKTVINIRS